MASHTLIEKINQIQRDLEQKTAAVEQHREELMSALEKNKEPSETSLIDIPLKCFSDDVVDISALDAQFTLNVEKLVKESEKLQVEMTSVNFQSKTCIGKKC